MKINMVKRAGDAKKPKFKTDNKAHQDALNRKASNFGSILSFLGEIDLTGFRKQGSGALGRKITIPNTLEKYTSTIPSGVESSDAHQQVGLASIEADNPAGFKILPMLNEKQFYAVLVNYYESTGTRRRKASRGLKNFKSDYLDYKKKYKEEVTQKIIKAGLTKKEDLKAFEEETKRLRNKDNPSGNFKYYDVVSTPAVLKLGGAKQMKGRERDTTEGMGRSFPLTYIHKPGVLLGDPYTNFIKDLLMSATKKTAAANPSYRDAKILEGIVSRHEMLYEIYLKNKKKEKIKNIILEKYKSGDVMIGSLKSLTRDRGPLEEPVDFETDVTGSEINPEDNPETTTRVYDDTGKEVRKDGFTNIKADERTGDVNQDDVKVNTSAVPEASITALEGKWKSPVAYLDSGRPVVTSLPSPNRKISGSDTTPRHDGVDFRTKGPVDCYSIYDGTVIHVDDTDAGSYGQYIDIEYPGGFIIRYAHLRLTTVTVDREVKAGQKIGITGMTGSANGHHLHMEVMKRNGEPNWVSSFNWLNDSATKVSWSSQPLMNEYIEHVNYVESGFKGEKPKTGDYYRNKD